MAIKARHAEASCNRLAEKAPEMPPTRQRLCKVHAGHAGDQAGQPGAARPVLIACTHLIWLLGDWADSSRLKRHAQDYPPPLPHMPAPVCGTRRARQRPSRMTRRSAVRVVPTRLQHGTHLIRLLNRCMESCNKTGSNATSKLSPHMPASVCGARDQAGRQGAVRSPDQHPHIRPGCSVTA